MEQQSNILFIDDNAEIRQAFGRVARGKFALSLADSGKSALQLAQETQFSVVIVDYELPESNGLQLIDKIAKIQHDVVFILISGLLDLDLAVQAMHEHGVLFTVSKPWSSDDLLRLIERGVETHWERVNMRQIQRRMVETSRDLAMERRSRQEILASKQASMTAALLQAYVLRGHETLAHCRRLAAFAKLLATHMGLHGDILKAIEQGALLHDIGQLAISDAILNKEGSLTPQEWNIIRRHPEMGAALLKELKYPASVCDVVHQHHERWDGGGYPANLKGPSIYVGAQVVSLCDAFDAMTSHKPYRAGLSIAAAKERIREDSGRHFDPDVASVFYSITQDSLQQVMT